MKRTPLKRSTKPIKKSRSKPRPGRLKGDAMTQLRSDCFERDRYYCQHETFSHVLQALVKCCARVTWETGHMAHKISRGRGGKDELSNVVTKCAHHHMVVEHSYGPSGVKPCPKKIDTD